MFSARNTDTPNPFRPALQYLLKTHAAATAPRESKRRSHSIESLDSEDERDRGREDYNMNSQSQQSSSSLQTGAYPLITLSRSPSPHVAKPTSLNPEVDSEDEDMDQYASGRPFLLHDGSRKQGWKAMLQQGGLGQFFFTTTVGWQVYVGILVLWVGGCGIGLLCMNRIVLLTGVYKFPYPLATTLFQLLLTHFLLIVMAKLTQLLSPLLNGSGFSAMVAPTHPLQSPSHGFRGTPNKNSLTGPVGRCVARGTGGIAGGGFFEFDTSIARQVLPLAIIYVAKVLLSNLSFAYAQLPMYLVARMALIPLSLIFTSYLGRTSHTVTTLSAALTATLFLLIGTYRSDIRVTWESITAGAVSSIFVALYPVQIQRTYRTLVSGLVPQGELLTGLTPSYATGAADSSGSKEESRAVWRLFHYTSLLAILVLTPIVLLSGELGNIYRNCYFLDVFFHWLMMTCSGIGAWAVFFSTIVLTKATSPFTVTFLFVPKAAFILPALSKFKMPVYSWVGIGLCWLSCAWFLLGKRREGPVVGRGHFGN